jgi:hypothetical protein
MSLDSAGQRGCGDRRLLQDTPSSADRDHPWRALKRIQGPFFGDIGLSCAYCEK